MDQFVAEWQTWHDARISDLATPFGWLSITDMQWLHEGTNEVPGAPGTFERNGQEVRLQLAPGASVGPTKDTLELLSQPSADIEVHVDGDTGLRARLGEGASLNWFVVDHVMYELLNRDGNLAIRVRDSKAPLLQTFVDVPTFTPSSDWVLRGTYTAHDTPRRHRIGSAALGLELDWESVGEVRFEIAGTPVVLQVDGNTETGLNITFHDLTNGRSTASWRRMGIGLPDANGEVLLDFNRAVNYPFAFTPFATCPAPIAGNIVPFDVTAGERRPTRALSEEGLNTPVLFIETSGVMNIEHLLSWWRDDGLDLTRVRLVAKDELPPLAGFQAVILVGFRKLADVLDAEQQAALVDLVSDAMAQRLPVAAVGQTAHLLRNALALEDFSPAAAEAGEADPSRLVYHEMTKGPDAPRSVPIAVSPELLGIPRFPRKATTTDAEGVGYFDVEADMALEGETDRPLASPPANWHDLARRFSVLLKTRD